MCRTSIFLGILFLAFATGGFSVRCLKTDEMYDLSDLTTCHEDDSFAVQVDWVSVLAI
jgi:hypothetical protein